MEGGRIERAASQCNMGVVVVMSGKGIQGVKVARGTVNVNKGKGSQERKRVGEKEEEEGAGREEETTTKEKESEDVGWTRTFIVEKETTMTS